MKKVNVNRVFAFIQHITPLEEQSHNSKNTTFHERGKTTGQGDAIAPKNDDTSPLSRPF
jgi:hypothetical protein